MAANTQPTAAAQFPHASCLFTMRDTYNYNLHLTVARTGAQTDLVTWPEEEEEVGKSRAGIHGAATGLLTQP